MVHEKTRWTISYGVTKQDSIIADIIKVVLQINIPSPEGMQKNRFID